ncbi:putative inhibitor of apoptosis [Daktulosphaira vitifoliae]|uniref:putative inhibitor of apoptosis n=1 Tax=Daktulosphaira vitifoliae TaxID=58002 RepID=UPI0021A9ABF5|nr:putative inhibitor of apoptosis [Daktulosphaira vitifoliae]
MAKTGFYYSGKRDCVRCMFYSNEFDCWQRGKDSMMERKRKSPQCLFFRDSSAYDVCGLYGSPLSAISSSMEAENNEYLLEMLHQIKTPNHILFSTYTARMTTFDKCQRKMMQKVQYLCEAGFFYIGNGQNDRICCFCCSQVLRDWDDNDEPLTEHARWSPKCAWVLFKKGKIFIDKACGKKDENN